MKNHILNLLLFIFSISSFSQNDKENSEESIYVNLYKSADSLKIHGNVGKINPETYKVADSLDALHPSSYYEKTVDFLGKSKFNDAAFLFFVGNARFGYFNSANPDYKPSGDGALKGALGAMIGEPIGMYLKTNVENFISILKSSKEYYTANNFKFYSKENNSIKFELEITNLEKQISELEKNKKSYQRKWNKETKEMKKLLTE